MKKSSLSYFSFGPRRIRWHRLWLENRGHGFAGIGPEEVLGGNPEIDEV